MFIPKDRVPLPGTERVLPKTATYAAAADPNESIDVVVRLHPSGELKAAASAAPLSREAFEQKFGAKQADIRAIEEFAHEHELTVVSADAGSHTVILRGTVAQMSQAFGTELRIYNHAQGRFRGRSGPLYVPASLEKIVSGVFGLDNRPVAKPHFQRSTAQVSPHTTFPAGSFSPPEVAAAYSFPKDANGKGQCIGIIELGGGYRPADLARYFKSLGLPEPKVTAISVSGGHNKPGDPADGEVMLDIEVAGAVANGASIAVYFAPNTDAGFLNAIVTAAHDKKNKPSVISISWGSAEVNWTKQALDNFNNAIAAAAAMGVTVCVAAGDNGADDGVGDGKLHVDFPASSPYALGCGGTKLTLKGGKVNDVVWNDGPNSSTGGGFSSYFAIPQYQNDIVSNSMRGVPDLAGDADPNSGYQVLVDGQFTVIGGTSAVAPLMAGLLACINQKLGSSVGFINPAIYQDASAFRDVTQGNNNGQDAKQGWDACTGMGVPIGTELEKALGQKRKTAAA
jgi:kumamolisin